MITIVLVTYNPNIRVLEALVSKLLNFNIVIVDNNSNNTNFENFDSVKVISLNKNMGIAYAQNKGIEYAMAQNAEYIVFFDQDSNIDHEMIDLLVNDFETLKSQGNKIAAIGPRFVDEKKGFFFPGLKFNKFGLIDKFSVEHIVQPVEVSFLISSGTLVSVSALKDIGVMKDEYFIDYVDTEWCFRALSLNYKLFMSSNAVMKHSIGDDTLKLFNFNIPVHSGFRRYYRVRNLFFMWDMPYIPKILVLKLMVTNFAIQILLLLLKDKKLDYFKYYVKAIKDGLSRKV